MRLFMAEILLLCLGAHWCPALADHYGSPQAPPFENRIRTAFPGLHRRPSVLAHGGYFRTRFGPDVEPKYFRNNEAVAEGPQHNATQRSLEELIFPEYSSPVVSSALTRLLGRLNAEPESASKVAKKNVGGFPYICHPGQDEQWRDLGPDYYPRNIRSVICNSTGCPSTRLCRPIIYPVRVLKKIPGSVNLTEFDLARLPDVIKGSIPDRDGTMVRFIFEEVTVNVGCECMNRN